MNYFIQATASRFRMMSLLKIPFDLTSTTDHYMGRTRQSPHIAHFTQETLLECFRPLAEELAEETFKRITVLNCIPFNVSRDLDFLTCVGDFSKLDYKFIFSIINFYL